MTLMKAPVIRDRYTHAPRPLTTALLEIMTDTLYPRFLLLPLVLLFLILAPLSLQGQTGPTDTTLQLNHLTSFSALPNGIDLRDGDARMQIVALREDVVRIRVSRSKELPEDASWAVIREARQSSIAVVRDESPSSVGFRTKALRVSINRQTFSLTIADLGCNVLQQDARPVEFHGDSFRVYKTMPLDEHYFGLGDKPGPLDRRGQAFTMWNTDEYGFQESSDPLYKTIPYFMAFRSGRALGISWTTHGEAALTLADRRRIPIRLAL